MIEAMDMFLNWAPAIFFVVLITMLLILFGFCMGRKTQDKPIFMEKPAKPPKRIKPAPPDMDIFRDAMMGDEKDERIATTRSR